MNTQQNILTAGTAAPGDTMGNAKSKDGNERRFSLSSDVPGGSFQEKLEALDKLYELKAKLDEAEAMNEKNTERIERLQKTLMKQAKELEEEKIKREKSESELALVKTSLEYIRFEKCYNNETPVLNDTDLAGTSQKLQGTLKPEAHTSNQASESGQDEDLETLKEQLEENKKIITSLKREKVALKTRLLAQKEIIAAYQKSLKPLSSVFSKLKDLNCLKEIVEADNHQLREIATIQGSVLGSPTPSMCPSMYNSTRYGDSISGDQMPMQSLEACQNGELQSFEPESTPTD